MHSLGVRQSYTLQSVPLIISRTHLVPYTVIYTEKKTIGKTKRQPTEWKNIFANDTSDKGWVSKIYKELKQINTPPKNTQSN